MRLHHVQVGIPAGGEDAGRRFYRDGLGLAEIDKPAELAKRGGAWFRDGGAEIHLGVEADPRPPRRAHLALAVEADPRPPRRAHLALAVDGAAELEGLAARLTGLGYEVDWSQRHNAERFERFHVRDPFGNRVEVVHEPRP